LYRDTAPVLANSFVTGDNFLAPLKFVPRSGSNSTKFLLECKTCAIPSLHRDSFLPKVPLSARCLRQVTLTNYTAAPLAAIEHSGAIITTVSIPITAWPTLFAGKGKSPIHRVLVMYLDKYVSRFSVPQTALTSQASFSIMTI